MIDVIEKVAECLVEAGSTFREDQKEAYRRAIAEEPGTSSCWVMQQVLDNALVAEDRRRRITAADPGRRSRGPSSSSRSPYGHYGR